MSGAMPQPLAGDFDEHRSALFDNTYNELRLRGYAASEIVMPDWGSKTCTALTTTMAAKKPRF